MTDPIKYKKIADGASVSFPYDKETVASLRKKFPKARWNPAKKEWTVPGVRAGGRVEKWAAVQSSEMISRANAASLADQRARDALTFSGRKIDRTFVRAMPEGYMVNFPYDADVVSKVKSIDGAKWNQSSKTWSIPYRQGDALKAVLPSLDIVHERARAKTAALQAQKQLERQSWAKEKATRDQASRARRAQRILMNPDAPLKVGQPVKVGNSIRTVEGIGKYFRISEDMPSMYSAAVGREGEKTAFAYTRDATPEEVKRWKSEAIKARVDARDKTLRRRLQKAMNDLVSKKGELLPSGSGMPQGRRIMAVNAQSKIYGGGTDFILKGKTLYQISNNGMDGDDWSRNNVRTGGAGAVGKKVSLTPEDVRALKSSMKPKGWSDAARAASAEARTNMAKKASKSADLRINRDAPKPRTPFESPPKGATDGRLRPERKPKSRPGPTPRAPKKNAAAALNALASEAKAIAKETADINKLVSFDAQNSGRSGVKNVAQKGRAEPKAPRTRKSAGPTVKALKAEAKAAGLKGYSKLNKVSLMKALGKGAKVLTPAIALGAGVIALTRGASVAEAATVSAKTGADILTGGALSNREAAKSRGVSETASTIGGMMKGIGSLATFGLSDLAAWGVSSRKTMKAPNVRKASARQQRAYLNAGAKRSAGAGRSGAPRLKVATKKTGGPRGFANKANQLAAQAARRRSGR